MESAKQWIHSPLWRIYVYRRLRPNQHFQAGPVFPKSCNHGNKPITLTVNQWSCLQHEMKVYVNRAAELLVLITETLSHWRNWLGSVWVQQLIVKYKIQLLQWVMSFSLRAVQRLWISCHWLLMKYCKMTQRNIIYFVIVFHAFRLQNILFKGLFWTWKTDRWHLWARFRFIVPEGYLVLQPVHRNIEIYTKQYIDIEK